ncbi:type IX secretion system protein PorQ [soil metagenome]
MDRKTAYIYSFIISLFIFSNSYSQSNTVYNFLKLDVSARASALAGSFTAVEDDVNAIYYNPAALTTFKKPEASVGFYKYLLDINSGNIAFTTKYKKLGYIGIGLRYVNYGSFDKYDINSVNQGTFGGSDLAMTLGYANNFNPQFSYGGSLKLIYSSYDVYNSFGVAADLGLLYKIPDYNMSIGMSLLNAGVQLKSYQDLKENLPLDLRFGITKKLENSPLTIYLGLNRLTEEQEKFFNRFKNITAGLEFNVADNIDLRVGYDNRLRQDLKTGSSTGLAGFSAGFGFLLKDKYQIDYAFNSLGKIGSTHRINLGMPIN